MLSQDAGLLRCSTPAPLLAMVTHGAKDVNARANCGKAPGPTDPIRYREELSLHKKGFSTSVIAECVHVCQRRVQQTIREARGSGGQEGRDEAK